MRNGQPLTQNLSNQKSEILNNFSLIVSRNRELRLGETVTLGRNTLVQSAAGLVVVLNHVLAHFRGDLGPLRLDRILQALLGRDVTKAHVGDDDHRNTSLTYNKTLRL